MRANRRVDTKPEIEIRSILHRRGLRFRKDYPIRLSNGRIVHADIAFTRNKIAIFIDGCFWHSCPIHGTTPKSNRHYWIHKLRENRKRDILTTQELHAINWTVLRFWEHDTSTNVSNNIYDHITSSPPIDHRVTPGHLPGLCS